MTLKEKFAPFMYCFMGSGMLSNTQDETIVQWNAEKSEKIADEFAIEFAKYVLSQIYNMTHGNKAGISIETLLEIYKKETGL